VILLERSDRLGGKIRLAERLPGRGELGDLADWRAGECARRGVDVRLGTNATLESVRALAPDRVIVATGAVATRDAASKVHPMPVPGWERDFVLDHEAALLRAEEIGPRVVILDAVGHIEGIGLGELLARRGCEVTLVTPLPSPLALDRETAGYALPRAVQAGVRWRPNTVLAAIGEREVMLVDALSRQPETVAGVDHVVIRTHGRADAGLYFALRESAPELQVVRIGDAVAPRYADRAIYDGHLAGRAV
jgi:pyruvate/2-oxoglutarate dehydrogenase complex dihydrolipoamide dehydrogenase (E3) component